MPQQEQNESLAHTVIKKAVSSHRKREAWEYASHHAGAKRRGDKSDSH
jgi:hypothetical protein